VNNCDIFTPNKTVKYMVDKLGEVAGKRILEPGAGEGAFVKEFLARGAAPQQITAVDINPDFAPRYEELGINYRISDFLLEEKPIEAQVPFDFVIGNPPYLSRHSSYLHAHGKTLRKLFAEVGVYDTYSLFMYHSLRFLKPGGILCFIISDSFLTISYHRQLRHALLKNYTIDEIVLPPRDLFTPQGVNNSPCIIVVRKRQPHAAHKVTFVDRLSSEQEYDKPPRIKHPRQSYFLEIEGCPISPHVNRFVAGLFSSLSPITEVMEGHIGLHTHQNRRFIAAVEGTRMAQKFSREGRRVIPLRFLSEDGGWHSYLKKGGEGQYYREIEEAVDWSPEAIAQYDTPKKGGLFLQEGIIISGVSRRLAARYMPPGCLWDSNKAIGFVAKNSEVPLWYLLGLLNSRLYNFLAKGILNNTNCLQISDIRRLPFKYPSPQQKSTIESLVKDIIDHLKENPHYDYSEEQARLDEIIFELYNVSRKFRAFMKTNFEKGRYNYMPQERHKEYLAQVALLAEELGYTVEHLGIPHNTIGDMILRNPRSGRRAYIELEVTYQQQVQHTPKIASRWDAIQEDITKGEDAVFLWIGVRRRDLISQADRAKIPNAEQEYGKRLFSCVSYSDQNEIRVALVRCLGSG